MSNYNNATCRICGKGYHRCNCHAEGSWRKVTDTAEHYQIFCVMRDYNNGIIDANKASALLDKMDLSEKDSFRESVKETLTEIASKKKVVEKKIEAQAKQIANNIKGGTGNARANQNNTKTWKK